MTKESKMIKRKKKAKNISTSLVIASCGIIKEKTKGMTRGKTKQNLGKLMEDREVGGLLVDIYLMGYGHIEYINEG